MLKLLSATFPQCFIQHLSTSLKHNCQNPNTYKSHLSDPAHNLIMAPGWAGSGRVVDQAELREH